MPIAIDHKKATEILGSEAGKAAVEPLPALAQEWLSRVNRLGVLCPHGKSSTVIAALGTALLAKATNAKVDVYSLLDRGESATSYSARSLADGVLAKHRSQLGIDLGANGTNPLNNTPFIGKTRIDEITGVRNQEGWDCFIECLNAVKALKTKPDARLALRGFIKARRRSLLAQIDIDPEAGDALSFGQLVVVVTEFVEADSDGGRRAQAVVAASLDVVFPQDVKILVGAINDPDRHAPLDVSAQRPDGEFLIAAEVKDKPIEGHHIRASVEKTAANHTARNLAFVAVSQKQSDSSFDEEMKWAAKHGFRVSVFRNWHTWLLACKCFARPDGHLFEGALYRQLLVRAVEIGVSEEGITLLKDATSGD